MESQSLCPICSYRFIKYLPTLPYLPIQTNFPLPAPVYANAENANIQLPPNAMFLSIPNTRLHIPIIRIFTSPPPILSSPLCTTHPRTLWHGCTTPPLLHGRRPGLATSWMSGSAAASGDAAEDGDEKESAYAGANTDDEVFIVGDPAADFFGS